MFEILENQKILESAAKLTLVPPGSGGLVALLAAQPSPGPAIPERR